jgi:hypothetical protein
MRQKSRSNTVNLKDANQHGRSGVKHRRHPKNEGCKDRESSALGGCLTEGFGKATTESERAFHAYFVKNQNKR